MELNTSTGFVRLIVLGQQGLIVALVELNVRILTWDTWDGFSVDYRGQSPLRDPPSFLRRLREL